MKKQHARLMLPLLVGTLMTGCIDQHVQPQVEEQQATREQQIEEFRKLQGMFKRHERPYVSSTMFEEPVPRPAYLSKRVMVSTERPVNLKYYTQLLSAQIGKPVRIGQDVYTIDAEVANDAVDADATAQNLNMGTGISGASLAERNTLILSPLRMKERLHVDGTAEQALDTLTSVFNIHWKYDAEQVTLYKLETRTFPLGLLSTETLKVDYNGTVSADENESGLSTTTSSEFNGATYPQYVEAIRAMLSPYGKVNAIGATGSVTVTDTPEKLGSVEAFVKNENKTLLAQVAMDVQVVTISSRDGSDVGVIWNNVLADLGDISLSGFSNQPTFENGSPSELTATITGGRLSGTALLLKALDTKARVSVVTRETRTVLNNVPTTIRDVARIEYPSEVELVTEEGVTTATTTKDAITPGFDMTLLPRITPDNRVVLHVTTTMSRDAGFEALSTGDFTQKFYTTSTKSFRTVQVIRNSATGMLTGYINSRLSGKEEGVGDSKNWVLGGGNAESKSRDMMVIFVTPHIERG